MSNEFLQSSEQSRFMTNLKELQRAQSDMIRVFEQGRKRGWLNSDELRDYNRQMSDYKRNLQDVERQTKAIQRAKAHHQAGIAGRESTGMAPTDRQLRKQEMYVRKERELVQLKKEAGRELAIAERRQKSIERMGAAGARREQAANSEARGEAAKSRAGHWARWGLDKGGGVARWAYGHLMRASHLHSEYEMARSGTERLGGVFKRGRTTPKVGWRRSFQLGAQMTQEIDKEINGVNWGKLQTDWANGRAGSGSWRGIVLKREEDIRNRILAKYKKKMGGNYIPGERGIYEGYGMKLGYSIQESHQLAQQGLRASPFNRLRDMRSNLAMFRGYSLDPGGLTAYHRAARGVGYEGGSAVLNRELIGAFTKGKFPRALMGEFVSSATQVLNNMQSGGGVVRPGSAGNLLSVFSRAMGQGYRNDPARTAQFMSSFHRGIQNPGGGDSGKAFQMRAFGLGNPGVSLWDIYRRQDQGLNYKNVNSILRYGKANYGEYTKYVLRDVYGLKAPAIDKLWSGFQDGKLDPKVYNQVARIGRKQSEFSNADKFRSGFKSLELGKLAEQAEIAAKNVAAVTTAYELQIGIAQATAEGIGWVTDKLRWMLRVMGIKVPSVTK